jgi:hypothetical protein
LLGASSCTGKIAVSFASFVEAEDELGFHYAVQSARLAHAYLIDGKNGYLAQGPLDESADLLVFPRYVNRDLLALDALL